jgi:hypothetical protein
MIDEAADLYAPVPRRRYLEAVWMVLYRKDTGEITQVMMQAPDNVGLLVSDEIGSCEIPGVGLSGVMEGLAFARTRYVDASAFFPQIRERAKCMAALDGMTLRDLPLPCQIEISAPLNATHSYAETEHYEVDLSFDHPGTYTVRVLSPRHLPATFTVTV